MLCTTAGVCCTHVNQGSLSQKPGEVLGGTQAAKLMLHPAMLVSTVNTILLSLHFQCTPKHIGLQIHSCKLPPCICCSDPQGLLCSTVKETLGFAAWCQGGGKLQCHFAVHQPAQSVYGVPCSSKLLLEALSTPC